MSRYTRKNKNYLSTILVIVLSILLIGTAVVFAVPESRNAILDSMNGPQIEQEADKDQTGEVEDEIEDVTPGDEVVEDETTGE